VRAPLQRVLAIIATAVLTLTLGASTAGLAQDPTDEPLGTPSPFCSVLTAAEASAALGVTLTVGASTDLDCSYDSDFTTTDVSLDVRREIGPLTDDYPRSYYPDGIDVPCVQQSPDPAASPGGPSCPAAMTADSLGGRPAYYDAESTILFVDEGANGQLFVLQLFGTPPDQIDIPAALMSLAVTGLPRLASIPVPPTPTDEPQPSYFGDAELAAMVPTEIGGSPVDVQTMSGADILGTFDPTDPYSQAQLQSLEDQLSGMGKTIDDMSLALGSFPTDTSFGDITAVRLKGADIASVVSDLVPLLFTDVVDPVQTPTVIAGKNVIILSDGPLESAAPGSPAASVDPYAVAPDRAYLYPKGEVLWSVSADEPALTEVFQKLP
jgi:hypothetical protein